MNHPDDCECVTCYLAHLRRNDPERAERLEAEWKEKTAALRGRQLSDIRQTPPRRRGKPVVSKGCRGCHKKRKIG